MLRTQGGLKLVIYQDQSKNSALVANYTIRNSNPSLDCDVLPDIQREQ